MLDRFFETRLLQCHPVRHHGPQPEPPAAGTSLPVLFESSHNVHWLPIFDAHFTRCLSGSGIVGLQGPTSPTAYLPVRACHQSRACEEVALVRQDPASCAKNKKHHCVLGSQRRGTQNLEHSPTRHQVFHFHPDLPAMAQDYLFDSAYHQLVS